MSIQLNKTVFSKCLGSRYRLDSEAATGVSLELIEVAERRGPVEVTSAEGQSFSLLFRGPLDYVLSPQNYRLVHETLGVLDLRLVPVGMDESGLHYEAILH